MKIDNILFIVAIIALSFVILIFLSSLFPDTSRNFFLEEMNVRGNHIEKVAIEKEKIFQTIIDIKEYPKIFPKIYKSIKIINQTNNVIFTEEEIIFLGNIHRIVVKRELYSNDQIKIEVVEGNAKNTKINLNFQENGNNTIISVNYEINFDNVKIEPGSLPKNGFKSEIHRILEEFEMVASKK